MGEHFQVKILGNYEEILEHSTDKYKYTLDQMEEKNNDKTCLIPPSYTQRYSPYYMFYILIPVQYWDINPQAVRTNLDGPL